MDSEDQKDLGKAVIPKIWNFDHFKQLLFTHPMMTTIFGDFGIGKTTAALQLAMNCIQQQQKVFYCYTKESIPHELIKRVMQDQTENVRDHLILWNPHSFNKQQEIIYKWLLQVQQLKEFFQRNRIGLIVIDEIASLYLLEMGSDEKNSSMNHKFTYQLATLAQISSEYHIPILLLNSYATKKDEAENYQDVPHGGKIVEYWIQLAIKMERTAQFSKRQCSCVKNLKSVSLPQNWIWMLESRGFA